MTDVRRVRGLVALIRDAVVHGSSAIERVQLETARRPFVILEQLTQVEQEAKLVHEGHDMIVKGIHAQVRGVTVLVSKVVDVALAQIDTEARSPDAAGHPPVHARSSSKDEFHR